MKKRLIYALLVAAITAQLFACGSKEEANTPVEEATEIEEKTEAEVQEEVDAEAVEAEEVAEACPLEDGVYKAKFNTDSTMFHVNEACEGYGELVVSEGKMTIHVSLASQGILNLYCGLAEDAAKEGAQLLEPTVDTVTYSDGLSEEVFGYDIPVPYLDKEFDVALIGKKEKWYDHKVSVTDVELVPQEGGEVSEMADGQYQAEVTLEGGTGKATIESPVTLTISGGTAKTTLTWSSKNYDYMIVDGEKYLNESADGQPSTFTIPVAVVGGPIDVIADTVAMSTPHEIEYKITFRITE